MKISTYVLLKQDILRWCEANKMKPSILSIVLLWFRYDEFKCLVMYRLHFTRWKHIFRLMRFIQKRHNLYIYADYIEGGFMPFHSFSTIIHAHKIGKNCTVFQNVTIGYNNGGKPVLGDNVTIYAGAVVIGPIRVGDNVEIGANSVVVKDVPSNVTVAGVPAKIIKYKDKNERF